MCALSFWKDMEVSDFISAIQAFIMLCALIAAYIIGRTQNQINQALLNTQLAISVEIIYDAGQNKFNIYNKGKTSIYLWGTKVGDSQEKIEDEPRLITQGGSYYIPANSVEFLQKEGMCGDLKFYVTNRSSEKYIVTTRLFIATISGERQIHTQTISIEQQEWPPYK